jgi:hypothetical protein
VEGEGEEEEEEEEDEERRKGGHQHELARGCAAWQHVAWAPLCPCTVAERQSEAARLRDERWLASEPGRIGGRAALRLACDGRGGVRRPRILFGLWGDSRTTRVRAGWE